MPSPTAHINRYRNSICLIISDTQNISITTLNSYFNKTNQYHLVPDIAHISRLKYLPKIIQSSFTQLFSAFYIQLEIIAPQFPKAI